METRVAKSQFKPKALKYLRDVERTGKPIVITDRGRPVVKISPYAETPEDTLEILRDTVVAYEKPLEPVGPADWEALK